LLISFSVDFIALFQIESTAPERAYPCRDLPAVALVGNRGRFFVWLEEQHLIDAPGFERD